MPGRIKEASDVARDENLDTQTLNPNIPSIPINPMPRYSLKYIRLINRRIFGLGVPTLRRPRPHLDMPMFVQPARQAIRLYRVLDSFL